MSNQEFNFERIPFATVQAYIEGRLDTEVAANIFMQSLNDKVLRSRIELTRLLMEIFLGDDDDDDIDTDDDDDDNDDFDFDFDNDDDDDDDDDEAEGGVESKDAIENLARILGEMKKAVKTNCDCINCSTPGNSYGPCPSALEVVRHAHDGLDADAASEIDFHLSLCDRCRREFVKMRASAERRGTLPPPSKRQARLDLPDQDS